MVVIEMNPRVFALLRAGVQGHRLSHRQDRRETGRGLHARRAGQRLTKVTPASFEPTIDYVVTKIPRFRLREVPRFRTDADHRDEIRGRGHGHRPHLPREHAKGAWSSLEPDFRLRRDRIPRCPCAIFSLGRGPVRSCRDHQRPVAPDAPTHRASSRIADRPGLDDDTIPHVTYVRPVVSRPHPLRSSDTEAQIRPRTACRWTEEGLRA